MKEIFLALTTDVLHPNAGDIFKVIVTLEEPASQPLMITFEKHRVYIDGSGRRALCVIQPDYFTKDGYPKPIDLKKGDVSCHTDVKVSSTAKNPPCPDENKPPEPVMFPDRLMLTAMVSGGPPPEGDITGKEHIVLTIRDPKT